MFFIIKATSNFVHALLLPMVFGVLPARGTSVQYSTVEGIISEFERFQCWGYHQGVKGIQYCRGVSAVPWGHHKYIR